MRCARSLREVPTPFSTIKHGLKAAICFSLLSGCGNPASPEPRGAAPPPVQSQQGYGQSGQSVRSRQAAFLNEIRNADPSYQTIQKALINGNNEVGLILSRTVEMDTVPTLMRSILTRMAREFPGQDLTVIAYAPSNPPRTIGSARMDAQTRQITYTRAQPQ